MKSLIVIFTSKLWRARSRLYQSRICKLIFLRDFLNYALLRLRQDSLFRAQVNKERLGTGSSSNVYRALQKKTGKFVAVKRRNHSNEEVTAQVKQEFRSKIGVNLWFITQT